jgi:hypothetical protein
MFRKLDLFLSSGYGKETPIPTLLGPLETANFNHWILPVGGRTQHSVFPNLKTETDTVSETLYFLVI